MFYVAELPIPELKNDKYSKEIIERVGKLICTTREFDALKKEIGIKESETDPSKRQILIAQINAYAAKVYNLTRDELEYILSTFPIVEENIKKDVLTEFDKIK